MPIGRCMHDSETAEELASSRWLIQLLSHHATSGSLVHICTCVGDRPTKYTESNMATDFRRWNVGLRKWNSTSTMAHWHVVEPSVAFFLPLDVYAQCQRLYRRCRECCVTVLMAAGWYSGCRRRQLMTPAIKCASTPPTVSLFSITHYVYTCIINRRSCDHPTDISRRRTHRHWIYRLALMSRLTCDFCTNCKCFTFDSH